MMKVIVDTCIWSQVFRRRSIDKEAQRIFRDLVVDGRVLLLGTVRQEVLSGIRDQASFLRMKGILASFPDVVMDQDMYELAAEYFNLCRSKGVQGSHTNFLICAVSTKINAKIYTVDKDFSHFASCLPISLLH